MKSRFYKHLRLVLRLHSHLVKGALKPTMPQEISVSYQAIKSKVYRLIDALVVGEKSEAEVQESIRRWWDLIHPADRPVAQKYLITVLGLSASALEAIGDGLTSTADSEMVARRMKIAERMVKDSAMRVPV